MNKVEKVAAALMDSFIDMVEAKSDVSFKETGVSMPSYEIWERYAEAAIKAIESYQPERTVAFVDNGVTYWSDGTASQPSPPKPILAY